MNPLTENKRLGEVLGWIKAQQDEARPPQKIKTNSERGGVIAPRRTSR